MALIGATTAAGHRSEPFQARRSWLAHLICGSEFLCGLLALALISEPPLARSSSSPLARISQPTPVILISVDTLRADHLSSYGYKALATPNIDSLARGGTVLGEISSQISITLPSRVSLFTSTYP